jgi:hypothetical protein
VERNRELKPRDWSKNDQFGVLKDPWEGVIDLVGNYYFLPNYHYKPLFRLSKIIKNPLYEGVDK